MLISDTKRFIFVHVPKTAGTSVKTALKPHALPRPPHWHSLLRRFGLPRDYRRYRFPIHVSLSLIERVVPPEVYRGYFKFAFVRNPWDRLVSFYHNMLERPAHPQHRRVRRLGSFDAYVRYEVRRGKLRQYPMLVDSSGRIGVDFLGRFENLAADFAEVCTRIGIESPLAHANRSNRAEYRSYYDPSLRELVREHWREDIEKFGYEF